MNEETPAVDPTAVRRAAMDLLARREHSSKELRQKLQRRFYDPALVEDVLARLAEENLQSDGRFAESYARQRAGRGYGPLRIRRELQERGVGDDAIALALEQVEPDWSRLAGEVLRKKFGEPAAVAIKERARRARFMAYRGFTADHFRHLIGE
jgi:regulatory protein